ncbi:MAG: hypothetical protein WC966_03150 [Bradymonadales bacterium]|jgi:FMN phosphatase YigB (HAD superfamily)
MKIIADFDGTITNIQHEYETQLEKFKEKVLELCDGNVELKENILQSSHDYIQDRFDSFGWGNKGRVTAFGDEDLFMKLLAQMQCLDRWVQENHPVVFPLRKKLLKDPQNPITFESLSRQAHDEMNTEPLTDFNCPEPEAVTALNTLLEQDIEIIIVSNSPTERIIAKLERVGLKPVDHEDNPSAQFRVRGLAKKFGLGDEPQYEIFGKRMIDTNRPNYRRIIDEERPLAVVGDVFSLDLALPMYLSKLEPMYDAIQVYLRMRPYTPQWAIDAMLNPDPSIKARPRLLNHFTDLPNLIHKR